MNDEIKAIFLGNYYGPHLHDAYGGAVHSIGGVAPAITTRTGTDGCGILVVDYE